MIPEYSALLFCIISALFCNNEMMDSRASIKKSDVTEWKLNKLIGNKIIGVRIEGQPGIVKCRYGKAVSFNGKSDGIFLDTMPASGLSQFTIEVILKPSAGGNFEQRYLHFGEIQGNRLLLELRSVKAGWYLDAFIKSGVNQCTLIDSQKLHPSDKWYHIACVMDKNKFTTFINGKKEDEGSLDFTPLETGKTSLGVRQNKTSWFKGSIFEIRVTGKALTSEEFIKL